jgi:hypothetical protein
MQFYHISDLEEYQITPILSGTKKKSIHVVILVSNQTVHLKIPP